MTLPSTEPARPEAADELELFLSRCEGSLDWAALFGTMRPVEIEIGSGKGRFIIRSSLAHPDTNYLGIERAGKFFRIMKQRVQRSGAANVRLLRSDAGHFIRKYVPPESVRAYHIYFPDPWPKKRHHKRRFVTADGIEVLRASLAAGGRIFFATDFKDYFDAMTGCARARPELREILCATVLPGTVDPEEAPTHYERKYLLQGRIIYKAVYEKIPSAP